MLGDGQPIRKKEKNMYVKSLVDGRYLHQQGFETWWDDKPTGWAVTFDKDNFDMGRFYYLRVPNCPQEFDGKRCAFKHECIKLVDA